MSEGSFVVSDLWWCDPFAVEGDCCGVEAEVGGADVVLREPGCRGAADARDLLAVDGEERRAESIRRSRSNLDDDEQATAAREDVELRAAYAHVGSEDLVARGAQAIRDERLGGLSALLTLARQRVTPP